MSTDAPTSSAPRGGRRTDQPTAPAAAAPPPRPDGAAIIAELRAALDAQAAALADDAARVTRNAGRLG